MDSINEAHAVLKSEIQGDPKEVALVCWGGEGGESGMLSLGNKFP